MIINMLDKIPNKAFDKAMKEIQRISKGGQLHSGWKKLKKCKGLLRFEITPQYRMVISENHLKDGPYLLMSHGTFDNKY